MGLDNKAERAFTLIHGMRFDDFVMEPSEEAGSEAADKAEKEKAGIGKIIGKVKISPNKYKELAPESISYFKNQLIEKSNYLLSLFEEDILCEAAQAALKNKEDKKAVTKVDNIWKVMRTNKSLIGAASNDNMLDRYYAVNKDGEPDENLQKELEKDAKEQSSSTSSNTSATSATPQPSTKKGSLYDEIEDDLTGEPSEVKPDEKQEDGWRYEMKNKGVLFLYKSKKDNKYYLSYNKPAEKLAKGLIDKYGLESAPETPED